MTYAEKHYRRIEQAESRMTYYLLSSVGFLLLIVLDVVVGILTGNWQWWAMFSYLFVAFLCFIIRSNEREIRDMLRAHEVRAGVRP